MIAIRAEYTASMVRNDSPFPDVDLLIVKIDLCKTSLFVINLYIPP